jgi:hypothetical protein
MDEALAVALQPSKFALHCMPQGVQSLGPAYVRQFLWSH